MTVLLDDAFTTNKLKTYTFDQGTSEVGMSVSGGLLKYTDSNDHSLHYSAIEVIDAFHTLRVIRGAGSFPPTIYLMLKWVDASNYLMLQSGEGALRLYSQIAGVFEPLIETAQAFKMGTPEWLWARMVGNVVTVGVSTVDPHIEAPKGIEAEKTLSGAFATQWGTGKKGAIGLRLTSYTAGFHSNETAVDDWIVEEADRKEKFPPTRLIDALERTEKPLSLGGIWHGNVGGEGEGKGLELTGEVHPDGWTVDAATGNVLPGSGAYWTPKQMVEGSATMDIIEPWTEESAELKESSLGLFVCYNPEHGSGYAAVYSLKRIQLVYVTSTGKDEQYGEVFDDFHNVESIGVSATHGFVRIWKKVEGVWSIVIQKPDTTFTEGYVAFEALGTEGKAAHLYAEGLNEKVFQAQLFPKGTLILPSPPGSGTNVLGMIIG